MSPRPQFICQTDFTMRKPTGTSFFPKNLRLSEAFEMRAISHKIYQPHVACFGFKSEVGVGDAAQQNGTCLPSIC
jgi:hypothetical protein